MTDAPHIGDLRGIWQAMEAARFEQPLGWVHPSLRPSNRRRPTVHQLKVSLKGVKPPIWRRVLIPSTSRLDEVALYLLGAMGWTNSHLHAFFIGDYRYEMIHPSYSEGDELEESLFTLRDVFDSTGTMMRFEYDFGDGWEHDVLLEAVRIATRSETEPACIGGRRACPPEDCGGPYGYGELLALLQDGPKSEWDRQRLEWLGDFDPNEFDADEATEWMRGTMNWGPE